MSATVRQVFIAGATGYMGNRLAAELVRNGHTVRGLVRAGSEGKLPPNCRACSNGLASDPLRGGR
jgi:nucleoside-diphosphate-sugar epimerase